MVWKKILSYLKFYQRQPSPRDGQPATFSLKLMHGINKLAILLFIVALVLLLIKAFR